MRRGRQPVWAAALCVSGALAVLAPAGAEPELMYRLEAGDRLLYERRATTRPLDGGPPTAEIDDQIELWCVQRREKEAFMLVALTRTTAGRAEPARAAVLYIDEGGRRRLPAEVMTRLDPVEPALDLLPVLPVGAQTAEAWTTTPDVYQRAWRCMSRGPDAGQQGGTRVDFVVEDPLGVGDALGEVRTGTYWFDARAGVVTRLESEQQDLLNRTWTHVSAVLRERTRQTPEWAARRTEEGGRFLRALGNEDRFVQELTARGDQLPRILERLDQLWSAFKSDIDVRTVSPFWTLADAHRQELRAAAEVLEARAALALRWLNRRAVPWTLQDAAGQTVTCEAARRGVVVECFWSGDSAAALRVLEPMRKLQAELSTSAVRVLGYNLDADFVRARQVIRQCGGGLTQFLGGALVEVETLPELPVVRVLDSKGVIRGVWVGWQPAYTTARDLALELARPRP